ncbi:MAG: TIR domain-containing protein [Actinomycetota bacterium]
MSGIFISYRRDDSGPWAGRVNDALVNRFGAEQVFLDVDGIRPGEDYRDAIARTIDEANVVLVVIGPDWGTVQDEDGNPRIGVKGDVHRTEIESALSSDLTVVPVLVGGANPPSLDTLPKGLEDLSYRNAMVIDDRSFQRDIAALADSLESLVEPVDAPSRPAAGGAPASKARRPLVLAAVAAVAAIIAIVAVIALSGGDDDPDTVAADTADDDPVADDAEPAPVDAAPADAPSDEEEDPFAEDGSLPPGQTDPSVLPVGEPATIATTVDGQQQCLESNNPDLSSTHNGASLVASCDTQSTGQRWTLNLGQFGYYIMQSEFGGDMKCFDADTDDYEEFGGAAMTNCNPEEGDVTPFHRYVIEDAGDGLFRIVSLEFQNDGFCLEANDPFQDDFGGGTFVTDCLGSPNQLWAFEAIADS